MGKNRNYFKVERWGTPQRWPYLIDGAPHGWEIVGTVDRGDESGALVRNKKTGVYCMYCHSRSLVSLPQSKVIAALEAGK